jgi:hypothetical protein
MAHMCVQATDSNDMPTMTFGPKTDSMTINHGIVNIWYDVSCCYGLKKPGALSCICPMLWFGGHAVMLHNVCWDCELNEEINLKNCGWSDLNPWVVVREESWWCTKISPHRMLHFCNHERGPLFEVKYMV